MTIYGDVLFLVNLYTDYFLLLAVGRFLHLRARRTRLAAGAFLGGGISLLALLALPEWLRIPLALVSAIGICLVAFFPADRRTLIKSTACFFAFSLLFGGIIFVLAQMTSRTALVGGSVYFDLSPMLLLLFTVLAYLLSLLLEYLRGTREPDSRFCKLVIEHGGKRVTLLAKVDTGNSLCEPFSQLPVLVAEKASLTELFTGIPDPSFRLVPFHSLGGGGLLPAFIPDRITAKGTALHCYLALHDGKLSAGSWNCLINPQALQADITQGGSHETATNAKSPAARPTPLAGRRRILPLHRRSGNFTSTPEFRGGGRGDGTGATGSSRCQGTPDHT